MTSPRLTSSHLDFSLGRTTRLFVSFPAFVTTTFPSFQKDFSAIAYGTRSSSIGLVLTYLPDSSLFLNTYRIITFTRVSEKTNERIPLLSDVPSSTETQDKMTTNLGSREFSILGSSDPLNLPFISNPQSLRGPYRRRPGSLRPYPSRIRSSSFRLQRESTSLATRQLPCLPRQGDSLHREVP
jgi:hypothetical protein